MEQGILKMGKDTTPCCTCANKAYRLNNKRGAVYHYLKKKEQHSANLQTLHVASEIFTLACTGAEKQTSARLCDGYSTSIPVN